ncbi:MAG: pseudouridine-5'-phosphate glycosidase [bacterium]|nr:pseudouridine-5'-phosphate glycosidase [bacterium]
MRPVVHPRVADALAAGRPVVALESTVYSQLGLPPGRNAEALERCLDAIESQGAIPAVTALLDGVPRVGLDGDGYEKILACEEKMAERDLPVAMAERWPAGATTVSGSLVLAHAAGIRIFATGGIGGVHRDSAETGDVSSDLEALARYRVATVCAGAKAFLDLPHTLERLETLGVPVVGYGCDELPAFWSRSSGLGLPYRVDTPAEAAAIVDAMGRTGVLFTVPPPDAAAVPNTVIDTAVAEALARAEAAGITGGDVTPYVLDAIDEATEGRSVDANVELVVNNARCAAAIARAAAIRNRPGAPLTAP